MARAWHKAGSFLAEFAVGEISEDREIGGVGDRGLDHGPAGDPEEATGDGGELNAGVLEDHVEAVAGVGALVG
jgi:hypothetical protein